MHIEYYKIIVGCAEYILKILNFFIFLKNIFENNFHMVKRELPAEKDTIFYMYEHNMPKSLLVFAVSFARKTPNFGTFGGVAHPH